MLSKKWLCVFAWITFFVLVSASSAGEIDGQTFKSKNGLQFTFDGVSFSVTHTSRASFLPLDDEAILEPIDLGDGSKLDVHLLLRWSEEEQVFRKWARFRLTGTIQSKLLEEVVLAKINVKGKTVRTFMSPGATQSYPVFVDGGFYGIEFPISTTRIGCSTLIIAHRPGLQVEPDTWYETRKAVYGVTAPGDEMRAFQRYIMAHRPPPRGIHIDYNSWWTSPAPYYTEKDILDLMAIFEQKLYKENHAHFDTFCIDMGWSNKESLWQIDPKLFPDGFKNIREAAERMDGQLGLWISPSSCYPPAQDSAWAAQHGYEDIDGKRLCLGGQHYQEAFRDVLVDMVKNNGVRHIKWDGYVLECGEPDHGHAQGHFSAEAIADGIILAAQDTHAAAPDTWFEPTCFGWNPSPWWLFYFNSVIGSFGDDAPYGRVPAPVYRESYTTARDYYNLQGAYWSPVPDAGQEVLGVIHQTNDPFLNDAVMTLMRGHMFLPVYLNPKYMDDARWRQFAEFLNWARKNDTLLENTEPLLPKSWQDGQCPTFTNDAQMPREPYGYAHWNEQGGIVALRNPWIAPQSYTLVLDTRYGFPKRQPGVLTGVSAVSLYPEPRFYNLEVHGDVSSAGSIAIPLVPYETLVLSIAKNQPIANLPNPGALFHVNKDVQSSTLKAERVEFEGEKEAFGPDWTSLVGDTESQLRLTLEGKANITEANAELLVLFDKIPKFDISLHINGEEVTPTVSSSDTGWGASGLKNPERWAFLRAPLSQGANDITLEFAGDTAATVSAWIWTTKPGRLEGSGYPNALPEPETISLNSVALLEPTDLSTISAKTVRHPRPIERIDGIFLDVLEPVSVTQGWGELRKNQSVWEKPMTIAGKHFLRGLGTHAPSKIVYGLEGKYKRFQAYAGADGATAPTITFEVWADGKKRWESGLMAKDDPAKRVDVDISNAQTLELIVGDGGNDLMADHADWADARLLRSNNR